MTEAELDDFLEQFEAGTLPKAKWTHAAHVLTGACYVHQLDEAAAIVRMRDRVRAYNVGAGGQNTATSGYHETITVFWIKLLAKLLREQKALPRASFATVALEQFQDRRELLRHYYSFDVVGSERARREWVAPDLHQL